MALFDRIFNRQRFPEPEPDTQSVKEITRQVHEQARKLERNTAELNRIINSKERPHNA